MPTGWVVEEDTPTHAAALARSTGTEDSRGMYLPPAVTVTSQRRPGRLAKSRSSPDLRWRDLEGTCDEVFGPARGQLQGVCPSEKNPASPPRSSQYF